MSLVSSMPPNLRAPAEETRGEFGRYSRSGAEARTAKPFGLEVNLCAREKPRLAGRSSRLSSRDDGSFSAALIAAPFVAAHLPGCASKTPVVTNGRPRGAASRVGLSWPKIETVQRFGRVLRSVPGPFLRLRERHSWQATDRRDRHGGALRLGPVRSRERARAVEAVETDLERFEALIAGSDDLRRLVRSPVFSSEDQIKAVTAVLDRAGIGGIAANFIRLVAENRRLFAVRDMIAPSRRALRRAPAARSRPPSPSPSRSPRAPRSAAKGAAR